MGRSDKQQRTKVFYVPCDLMKDILLGMIRGEILSLPDFSQIPAGAKAQYVFLSPERNAIGFVITHASFEELEAGYAAPEIVLNVVLYRNVKIAKVETEKVERAQTSGNSSCQD